MERPRLIDDPDRIDKLPKDRKDWLEIFGNQWGTRRFTSEETTVTPEERAALNAALNPFARSNQA